MQHQFPAKCRSWQQFPARDLFDTEVVRVVGEVIVYSLACSCTCPAAVITHCRCRELRSCRRFFQQEDMFCLCVSVTCDMRFVPLQDQGAIANNLRDKTRGKDLLVLWLDCDREGEAIGFEVRSPVRVLMHALPLRVMMHTHPSRRHGYLAQQARLSASVQRPRTGDRDLQAAEAKHWREAGALLSAGAHRDPQCHQQHGRPKQARSGRGRGALHPRLALWRRLHALPNAAPAG